MYLFLPSEALYVDSLTKSFDLERTLDILFKSCACSRSKKVVINSGTSSKSSSVTTFTTSSPSSASCPVILSLDSSTETLL
ncbi:MAG: hypothetical protein BWY36_00850 [Candidatus Diapherotrites archaeon ADurb.Bin253]|nr:MAG: hypothetical protein BWY36_00850 [Candidatus Diapherotrites archaeon ADurb.Bin253]